MGRKKSEHRFRLIDGVEEKKCARCKTFLELCEFTVDKKSADGLSSYCKDCKNITKQVYYNSKKGHKICLKNRKDFHRKKYRKKYGYDNETKGEF